MKQLQRFCAAALLTIAIAITGFAGDIQSPGCAQPLPPGDISSPAATSPAPGDIDSPGVLSANSVAEFTISLYTQLLSIF